MKNALNNKAFTLFELIIVVLLISIMYGVFVHKISNQKKGQERPPSIETIKTWLGGFVFAKEAKISCVDENPKECFLFLDGKKQEGSFLLFEEEPSVYALDSFGKPILLNFKPIFNENGKVRKVFFEFILRKNGSSSSYLVDSKKGLYLFSALSKEPRLFKSFEEAKEALDHYKTLPIITSDYQY